MTEQKPLVELQTTQSDVLLVSLETLKCFGSLKSITSKNIDEIHCAVSQAVSIKGIFFLFLRIEVRFIWHHN